MQEATFYSVNYAEIYDSLYTHKLYSEEAKFVDGLIRDFSNRKGRRLLEIACGTGSYTLPFEKLGYSVVAIDKSEGMLSVAKKKARENSAEIVFHLADMVTLELAEKNFDVATSFFDSIGYLPTVADLKSAFRQIHKHLCDGGLFIFDFWHAPAVTSGYDPVRVRRLAVPGGELTRIAETTLDALTQTATIEYSVYQPDGSGKYTLFREKQGNRYYSTQEMEMILESTGFELLKWYDGFSEENPVSNSTWHPLCVARRI